MIKINADIVELLLSGNITFSDTKNGDLRGHIYPPSLGDFFGETKLEIAKKIIKKKVQNEKKMERYLQLPFINNFIKQIEDGCIIIIQNKNYITRTFEDDKYWQFNFNTDTRKGKDWLHSIYCKNYIDYNFEELDRNGSMVYSMVRNNKSIDWNFWKTYEKLVLEFEKKYTR